MIPRMAQQGMGGGPERQRAALDALQRAHQLEQQGRVPEACDALERFVNSAWPWSRGALEEARTGAGGIHCGSSMALLNERRGRLFRQRQDRRAFILASFTLGYAALGAFATYLGLAGSSWWFIGTALAALAVPICSLGVVVSLWHRNAWQRPRWATVRSVTVLPDGIEIGPPTCIADLVLDSQPDSVRRINFIQGLVVEPGMRLLIVEQGSSTRFLP